jgi:hypothetical protein
MKQVNLKEFNITELRFRFWTNLTSDLLKKIESVVAPDEDGDYMFMESYKIDNVGHIVAAVVSKSTGEERYSVRGICEIGGGKRLGKGVVSVSKLLEIMSSIKEEIRVMCWLRLSFGRRQKPKTVISLPINITDMPKALYDVIHGIHFVKRKGKGFKYEVILDLERDGTLTDIIIYDKVMNIKESFWEDIIQEGIEISDGFVLRGKQ